MRRALKWVCAPAVLAAALLCAPSSDAKAQSFSYYFGSPRMSFGYSSGYGYAPWAGPGVAYGGYYGPRVYSFYPYGPYGSCGPPRPHYGHYHHGHGNPWHRHW